MSSSSITGGWGGGAGRDRFEGGGPEGSAGNGLLLPGVGLEARFLLLLPAGSPFWFCVRPRQIGKT